MTLHNLLIGAAAAIAIQLALIYLKRSKQSNVRQETHSLSTSQTNTSRLLYWMCLAILICSPLISAFISIHVGLRPMGGWIFVLIGLLAPFSLSVTLLIARLIGSDDYESYWRYHETSSLVRRSTIIKLLIVVSTACILLGGISIISSQ
jgi:hypothetical protein